MSEINITVKTSNADKTDFKADPSITVLEFKEIIAQKISVPANLQRLIYKGRVLKDESTLSSYNIDDGQTIHLVKSGGGTAPSQSTSTSTPSTTSTTTPPTTTPNLFGTPATGSAANPFGGLGGMNPFGMGGMGMGMGGMGADGLNSMQQELLRNPQMMQQVMNSPFMESLMNNPELMQSMIMNNPQMQAMMERNPHIRHILQDPAVSQSNPIIQNLISFVTHLLHFIVKYFPIIYGLMILSPPTSVHFIADKSIQCR
jgi:ubiquilin